MISPRQAGMEHFAGHQLVSVLKTFLRGCWKGEKNKPELSRLKAAEFSEPPSLAVPRSCAGLLGRLR